MDNVNLGRLGEEHSTSLLERMGHNILARNFKTKVGEIDIISEYKNCLYLTEVKTRSNVKYGLPYEAVDRKRLTRLKNAGYIFIKTRSLKVKIIKIQVISLIVASKNGFSTKIIEVD